MRYSKRNRRLPSKDNGVEVAVLLTGTMQVNNAEALLPTSWASLSMSALLNILI